MLQQGSEPVFPACAGGDIEATATFQLFHYTQEALAAEGHKRFPTYAVFQGLRNNMREATFAAPNSFQMLQVRSWHGTPCRLLWDWNVQSGSPP